MVWDLLKEKVHTNRPRTINDLKDNVRLETVIVAADTLQRVVACLDHRIQLCLEVGVTIFSTLCDGTQFHKYWRMHLQHSINIGGFVAESPGPLARELFCSIFQRFTNQVRDQQVVL